MCAASLILDRLVEDERIAADWAVGLRNADPEIDAKVDACLARVASVGPSLPLEEVRNAVIWRAFELPLAKVRVLILGQDPYPDPRRAIGLSFSTGPDGDIPRSLTSIYVELAAAGFRSPRNGDLSPWSQQGVLLFNRALTIPADKRARPKRHIRWWSPLALAAMKAIRSEAGGRPIAAMLWGRPAHRMRRYLEPEVEVFASSHPSPLSVGRPAGAAVPFRGSNPFGLVNGWMASQGEPPIDWELVDRSGPPGGTATA